MVARKTRVEVSMLNNSFLLFFFPLLVIQAKIAKILNYAFAFSVFIS